MDKLLTLLKDNLDKGEAKEFMSDAATAAMEEWSHKEAHEFVCTVLEQYFIKWAADINDLAYLSDSAVMNIEITEEEGHVDITFEGSYQSTCQEKMDVPHS